MRPPELTRRRTLALAAAGLTTTAGCVTASPTAEAYGPPRFEERARELGLHYEYVDDGDNHDMKSLVSSAGVYATDFDDDGRTDVLALGGEVPVMFRNTGEGFERADVLPDMDGEFGSALFLDYDNDGWEELLLLRLQGSPVFLDNRGGEFTERDVGFDYEFDNPVGASAADYDRDGYLDVFVVQNGNWDGNRPRRMSAGRPPNEDNGKPNVLFRGDGSRFERVDDAGLEDTRWTLATAFVDLTGDGYPDIYVANDYNYDVLYTNDGDGGFEMREVDNSNRNAMSATTADVSGDGSLDVFVTNIYFDKAVEDALDFLPARPEGNNLFVNDGEGHLTDEADAYGVRGGGWGWAATISDFTNSGRSSLFHTTSPLGAQYTLQQETGQPLETIFEDYPYLVYPMFFERAGEAFAARHPPEPGFEQGNGRGVVATDITNDGTLDLVVADVDDPYRVYENRSDAGNWIYVDVRPDTDVTAIGAEVTVSADGSEQYQVRASNADFLSQEPRTLHFGVGNSEDVGLRVVYPDGTAHEFDGVAANQHVTVWRDGTLEQSK